MWQVEVKANRCYSVILVKDIKPATSNSQQATTQGIGKCGEE
jgi:hypothetical protein